MSKENKVLITGGSGFIGSHITQYLQDKAEVTILDDLSTGFESNLEGLDCRFVKGSITDKAKVAEVVEGVDYVFHLAAMVSVPQSMSDPIGCLEINNQGLLNVLEASAEAGVKKLVFSSSAAIYGDNPMVPKLESMVPEPRSPYAITKLDGEYYCDLYRREGKLNTACLRYFNVFGPRQNPESAYAAAVPIFIHRALRNDPIIIYGDGGQTRDFVFVGDVVQANVFTAHEEKMTEVYNVGYQQRISILDLVEKIKELTGSSSEVKFEEERAGDVRHSLASADKIMSLGFEPKFSFEKGLEEAIQYFQSVLNQ